MRIHICDGHRDRPGSADTWQDGFGSQQQSLRLWFAFARIEQSVILVVVGSVEYLVKNLVISWVVFLQCLQSFVPNRSVR